jgi:E1A-binding protein p400
MEESTMDIEDLLKRFEAERDKALQNGIDDNQRFFDNEMGDEKKECVDRKVRFQEGFARNTQVKGTNASRMTKNVDGHIADDDADMSDVDDFRSESDGSEEFEACSDDEIDDMTTFEAELKMKPDIDPDEEIALLEKEAEMSIDELRAMYGSIDQNEELSHQDDSETSGSDEFEDDLHEVDDETTIEAEEKMGRDMSYEDEIALLKRESEMSVEELRQKYTAVLVGDIQQHASDHDNQTDEIESQTLEDTDNVFHQVFDEGDQEDQEEFQPEIGADLDDETTLVAEEKLGRDISYEEEIALLQQENEMSIEELRAMYCRNPDDDNDERSVELNESELSKKRKHENSVVPENKKPKSSPKEDEDRGAEALRSLEIADAKARNTMVSRPYLLSPWVKLREYQQVGLNWLVSIQARRLNGILADEMGLGKTLQTISLLSYLAAYKGIWGPHLIVVPTSCIVNWEVEIKRFCPAFKVLCYYGNAKRRKELRQGWTKVRIQSLSFCDYVHRKILTLNLNHSVDKLAPYNHYILSIGCSGLVCFQEKEMVLYGIRRSA